MKYLTLLTLSVMALSCKKDQPIFFDDDFDCQPCTTDYCVPIEIGDTSTIEVSLTEITENLITNGNFASASGWTVGANWAIGAGKATFDGLATSTLSRTVDDTLQEGYYLVKVDLTLLDIDKLVFEIDLGGQGLFSTSGIVTYGWTDKTYYFYGYITPSNNLISFIASGYSIAIDNVELYRLSDIQYEIKDCNTEEVFYTNTSNTGITYYESGEMADGSEYIQYLQGFASVVLNWTEINLSDGCYCICFKDAALLGYEFIENGTFASSANWVIANTGATGWSITAGVARHSNIAPPGDDVLSQTLVSTLDSATHYILSFDIIAAGQSDLTITYDTALTTGVALLAILGSGNYTQTKAFTGAAMTAIHFASSTHAFDMDNVSIIADPEYVLCETSNCISLRESWDAIATNRRMCNILVTGTNANKAFGFSAGYSFTGRIFGQIRNGSGRDVDTTIYKDLTGLNSLQYADRNKVKELQVFQVPQGVHDWLELALCSQTVTMEINGVIKTFVKLAGDYTPNWRKTSADAPVIVEIMEAQGLPANARNV